VVRHLDRPGVLAACLDAVSRAGINVQEMSNTVFDGSEAAVATISLEVVPSAELLETIKSAEYVLDASVVAG
jgi:D-3-phosphoglycerate dehydrogenase